MLCSPDLLGGLRSDVLFDRNTSSHLCMAFSSVRTQLTFVTDIYYLKVNVILASHKIVSKQGAFKCIPS